MHSQYRKRRAHSGDQVAQRMDRPAREDGATRLLFIEIPKPPANHSGQKRDQDRTQYADGGKKHHAVHQPENGSLHGISCWKAEAVGKALEQESAEQAFLPERRGKDRIYGNGRQRAPAETGKPGGRQRSFSSFCYPWQEKAGHPKRRSRSEKPQQERPFLLGLNLFQPDPRKEVLFFPGGDKPPENAHVR